ncbi:MAG: thioredoxin domain-containing protein [Nitrospirae bacterium]|nr:thioredoxin domain-containing protein [Nitrospirota bacterium]
MAKNMLKEEKSPYLLQHAENPVNWYAWTDEAFSAARAQDKPIFLSIGYSTCHWCHVMKRESFEDTEVASLMNNAFISVKVDREERPDIDNAYMAACMAITGSGGWPLTIIMLPDGKPFFAATYIPKHRRGTMYGMLNLIPQIQNMWQNERHKLIHIAEQLTENLKIDKITQTKNTTARAGTGIMDKTCQAMKASFDSTNGGFGSAPKFPTPHNIMFLLRYYFYTTDKTALDMAEKTLYAMRMGGIYDHLGYGFHRYSTDASWHVPHFEKMLYDQALLLIAYTEAFMITGDEFYKQTATEIITYVLRDMRSPEGAFYSAEDAETEGVEGKFYYWTSEEIRAALSLEEAVIFTNIFDVKDNNILHMAKTQDGLAPNERAHLNEAVRKLYHERQKRVRPHKDDKILTDLNGLMAAALAIAGRAFNDNTLISAAKGAVSFIEKTLVTDKGSLLHRYRDGQSAFTGTINDYASIIWALIELYEATFDENYLLSAKKYTDYLLENFRDNESGGLFFTDKCAEPLIVRQNEFYDGAAPSGNSIALYNTTRLAQILGDHILNEKSHELIEASYSQAISNPRAYPFFALATGLARGKKSEAVVAGEESQALGVLMAMGQQYLPNTVFVLKRRGTGSCISYTGDMKEIDGKPAIYICTNSACQAPVTDIAEALKMLIH